MTKRKYNNHYEISATNLAYVETVAAVSANEIDIDEINSFLNDTEDYLKDFDEINKHQLKKELGL